MNFFQAFVMGIVQGLTEFIPVSSSGHLVIFPRLFGWEENSLAFDTTLHLGTLTALVVYFFSDLKRMLFSVVKDLRKFTGKYGEETQLVFWLVLATIPAGLAGLFLETIIESAFRSVLSVASFLFAGSVLMFYADKKVSRGKNGSEDKPTLNKIVMMGLFQCLAIFPGVSRSGATISGGLFAGFTRARAARLSFLLSLPIIAAAGVSQLPDVYSQFFGRGDIGILAVGFIASAAAGYFSVSVLIKYLEKRSLKVFLIYRVVLASLLIIFHFLQ